MKFLSLKLFLIAVMLFSLLPGAEAASWKYMGSQQGDRLSLSMPVRLSRDTRYARSTFMYQFKKPLKIKGTFYKVNAVTMPLIVSCDSGNIKIYSLTGHAINKRITRTFRLAYVYRSHRKGIIRPGTRLTYASLFPIEKKAARFMCRW